MTSDSIPQDLVRYLAASTGLPQPTAIRVIADVNAYYDETADGFVRRRHAELRTQGHKNDEIWPRITAELNNRRFKAGDLTDRQLRRIVYGLRIGVTTENVRDRWIYRPPGRYPDTA
jgi:hypothetical protein